MSAERCRDWQFLGFKAWYCINNEIAVFSSTEHTWADLPTTGVQAVLRYWKNNERSWREYISGQDYYFEKPEGRYLITHPHLKVGNQDDTWFHEALSQLRAEEGTVDNSIESYLIPNKVLVSWKAWVVEDDQLNTYESSSTEWDDVPFMDIQMLRKTYTHEGRTWNEHMIGSDVYFLIQPSSVGNAIIKEGSVADNVILSQIYELARNDTEVRE